MYARCRWFLGVGARSCYGGLYSRERKERKQGSIREAAMALARLSTPARGDLGGFAEGGRNLEYLLARIGSVRDLLRSVKPGSN